MHIKETPTRPPFSGAENHLWVLLPELRAAGLRVEFGILLQQSGPVTRDKIAELQAAGIEVHCFPYRRLIDLACMARVRAYLASRRAHIVHTHMDRADIIGKVAARLAGCRHVVSSVHNNEQYHLRLKWLALLRVLDRLTTRHIAISEAVRRHLIELEHVASAKVTVIPYGVYPPPVVGDRTAIRQRLGIPNDRFVVGFVGRLVEQKNVPVLIRAMAQLPDALCVIIGRGAQRRTLEEQASAVGNVRFLRHQPDASALMPAFDVLCLPSRWEGLGLVLVEAMFQRVPVVGSRAGAIPEVLGHGKYGLLFDPDNVAELVAALTAVRESGGVLAEPAYGFARERFAVHKMIERTLAVYAQAAASDQQRVPALTGRFDATPTKV
ncbi:MAG: glycosyltransferase family 4 protein [Candidatus Binatia bacterium]